VRIKKLALIALGHSFMLVKITIVVYFAVIFFINVNNAIKETIALYVSQDITLILIKHVSA
jgi:hypothetical protein